VRRKEKLPNRRIRLLLVLFVLVFAGTLARAVWLQAVHAGSLAARAQQQHHETTVIPARRGTIFDRWGIQLAIGEQATTVYADPSQVEDPRAVALAAHDALGVDAEELYPHLTDPRRGFWYVQRKADAAQAAKLAKRKLPGLGFYPEERRIYPQGSVGAHVLGYAGVDNRGLSGLELELDSQLAGRDGKKTIVRDPFGRAIDVVSTVEEREGKNVFLTLDHTLQAEAEAVLRSTVRKWGAKAGSAIVLDPHSGGVLAMAAAPGYDANRFPQTARDAQRNRAVTDLYEPGSTFKIVTAAAVLTEGLVTPATRFTLQSTIAVADRVIHEAHDRGTRTMSVAQIIAESSNVGTITLAEKLGGPRLERWIERFGFGKPTGIDYPGESGGVVPPLEKWSGSTIATLPIGHGIAVTGLQMAAAYATVANGGVWVQPHLVDHVGSKRVKPRKRRVLTRVVSSQLRAILQDVVADGTGTLAAIAGYRVAGKTGTAAKIDPDGEYSDSRYVASFVGFVPASAPRLVILVSIDEPKGMIWGGVVAAPAFQQIAKFGLQYLEVPPDAPEATR
jgi:cell division protein FtsI/penicillin-binding protein 2